MVQSWGRTSGRPIPLEIDADAYPSIVELLDEAIRTYRDKTAFVGLGQALSYSDVDHKARAFSAYLQNELGVKKGDRVAVMLPNILAFPIAMLGIIRAGGVQVNVNPSYTARELEHQLCDSGADVIVVFNGATATLADVWANVETKHVITVALSDGGPSATMEGPGVDPRLGQFIRFPDVLALGATLSFSEVALDGHDLLFLQYTGGTTGLSKGAALSHRNLVANVLQFRAFTGEALRSGEERVITALPLYHIFALMVNFITCFSLGAVDYLVANPRDTDAFIDLLKQARPTFFVGVNTLYAGLVACPRIGEVDFSELRLAIGGGAAVIPATSTAWQRITGVPIIEGYGLSETSPVLTFNHPNAREFTGTAGLPLPSTDIKLLGDDGREVARGERGEICVKGPQVMRGYWEKPEVNETAFTADGYFRTGDIGQLDDQGCLHIVDRKKDMIIVSGFNVYPNEIEAVAAGCPGIAECACVGAPDTKTGERVLLYVVRSAASALTEADVIAHCRKQMAAYKVPRAVHFLAALPKSTVGKILRRELRNTALLSQ